MTGYTAKPGVVFHSVFGLEMDQSSATRCRDYHVGRLARSDIGNESREHNTRRLAELDAAIAVAWPEDAPA